jgi:tagatose-6-phosphate ketose/aldose isomerase
MALATWCLFGYRELDDRIAYIRRLADIAEAELSRLDDDARTVAEWEFDRIVYLGSGALKGLAREAAIKMLELTGGIVNSGWDTPAGFRHGPKSVIIGNAVTVHLLSNLPFTRKYDDCLLREVLRQRKANKPVAVAPAFIGAAGADIEVSYTPEEGGSREIYPYILGLLFIQLLALEKSLLLGISTDNPAPGGEVNRVVQGIEIYPLED